MRDREVSRENVTELFDKISPVYDLANRIISLGVDKHWRNTLLRHIPLLPDQTLCDLATDQAIVEYVSEECSASAYQPRAK